MIPNFVPWQWTLGAISAFSIGVAKTGVPGLGSFVAPLMVLAVGDARFAAAWTLPILSTADVFAVLYWRKHADARKLFSLVPWVAVGMIAGAFALALTEHMLRRIIGCVVVLMLIAVVVFTWHPNRQAAAPTNEPNGLTTRPRLENDDDNDNRFADTANHVTQRLGPLFDSRHADRVFERNEQSQTR